MRVLAISDLHANEFYLEKLKERKGKYDAVLAAGDTSNKIVSFVQHFLEIFPDAYIVHGNNERRDVLAEVRKARNYAHGKRIELAEGLNLVGFGFSNPTPFNTPGELDEDEIYERMRKLNIDGKAILLAHAPPYGVFDEIRGVHIGSTAIRKIIEEKQPLVVFCGHVHETEGIGKIGKTIVVKISAAENGRCCVAEIRGGKVEAHFEGI